MSFTAGSVWWGKIDFQDGNGERKKYLILLTDCVNAGARSWIVVTTSKGDKRFPSSVARSSSPCGCPKEPYFRIDGGTEQCFPVSTWVEFDNSLTMSKEELVEQKDGGKIGFIQALNGERLRAILNCAKKSKDIAKVNLVKIEQTLKALNPVKAAKSAGSTPTPPPAHAGIELAQHIDGYCYSCRTTFLEVVQLQIAELEPLKAAQVPAENFINDIRAGTELVPRCEKCSRLT